jgi:hypothetical protein
MYRVGLAGLGKVFTAHTLLGRRYLSTAHEPRDRRSAWFISGGAITILVCRGIARVCLTNQQAFIYSARPTVRLDSQAATQTLPVVPSDDSKPALSSSDYVTGDYISTKEVARHNLAQDAWVIVEGKVYE